MKNLTISTGKRETLTDITDNVLQYITDERIRTGFLIVSTPDNECSIIGLSNQTEGIEKDFISKINFLYPIHEGWDFHGYQTNNIRSSLVGTTKQYLIEDGTLILGAYERIYLVDFNGPSDGRMVLMQAVGNPMEDGEKAVEPESITQYNNAIIRAAEQAKIEEQRAIEEMRREYREQHPETAQTSDAKDKDTDQ